jgi:phospholipase/lecithinase/hemolysin
MYLNAEKAQFMQEFGQSLSVSMMKAWVQFHHAGKEFANKESASIPQIATRNLLELVGL